MDQLTGVKRQLLEMIANETARRGYAQSLYHLTTEAGIAYRYAWYCLRELESAGQIEVERNPGYPLIMRTNGGDSINDF